MKKEKHNIIFISLAVVVIAAFVVSGYYLLDQIKREEVSYDVSSKFTCTCCDGNLLQTPDSCFMAGGMREYVRLLSLDSSNEEKVMINAAK